MAESHYWRTVRCVDCGKTTTVAKRTGNAPRCTPCYSEFLWFTRRLNRSAADCYTARDAYELGIAGNAPPPMFD